MIVDMIALWDEKVERGELCLRSTLELVRNGLTLFVFGGRSGAADKPWHDMRMAPISLLCDLLIINVIKLNDFDDINY